ncbi:Pr6Pr family membrane protein [Frigoribacterium sp. CG_9.8]|uniref:Pr6Pr family membrane protein n=1 Tax=Frigoribacterium sp. CG_9.8 TaxID=2787733 RepID=UPI0018CA904B|nr:hypothetical protein [Frigoribacterium sp. CG_9.8]
MRSSPEPYDTAAEVDSTVKLRVTFGALRLLMAVVCLLALISRFLWGLGSATFTPGNFFAYLTIQSSILFLVVTVIAAIVTLRGMDDPPWLDLARATVLSCTVSCGVIFALIVEQSGERGFRIDVPWSDVVLHFVLPTVAVLDWIIGPGRGVAPWRSIALVLVFMIGWGFVTLVRGPIVGWYPYFFLDPAQLANTGQFLTYSTIAVLLFGGISAALVAASRSTPLAERWATRWAVRAVLSTPRTEQAQSLRTGAGRRR